VAVLHPNEYRLPKYSRISLGIIKKVRRDRKTGVEQFRRGEGTRSFSLTSEQMGDAHSTTKEGATRK